MSARAFLKTEMGKIALFIIVVALLGFAISMLSTKTIEGMSHSSKEDGPVSTEEEGSKTPASMPNEPKPQTMTFDLPSMPPANPSQANNDKEESNVPEKEVPEVPVGAPESTSSTEQCYTLQECSYTDGNVDMSSCKIIKTCMDPTPSVSGNISAKKCMISTVGADTDPSMCWTSNVSDLPDGINKQYI